MPVKWYKDIPDWANQNATTPDGSNVTPYTNMQNRIQMLEEQLRGLNEALHFINYGTNAPSARTSTRVWYGNYENVYTDYEIVGTLTNQITNVATAKKIDIGSTVTSIGSSAFYDCSGLTSVTIGNGVTSIEDAAFSGCIGLTSVTIPDSVTSMGSYAFQGCSGLTSVTIPASVWSIGDGAFSGCSGLTSITVDGDNPNYSSANGLLLSKDGTLLISGVNGDVVIPYGVTSIGDSAFESCPGLASVTIPNSVTSIGELAFFVSGLTSVTIPDSVTSMGYGAFADCAGLTAVTIVANGGNANNVKQMIIESIDNEEFSDNITWNMPN